MVNADKKSKDFKYTILASLMLLKKPNLISIGLLIFFGLFVAVTEFITLICLPLGLDLYLGTGLFSNINSVKIPEFLLYFLQAYNLTLLCSLIVVLSSSKLLYIFLQNRFAAFLAANFSKQFVELYLGSKRNVTRNDDSVVMARIFFGDIQVWASDFCQKIVTIFERSLFLLISLAYFVLYLPIYSIGLVGVFALISVFFVKVIQNKNENVGRELRFFSDKLMVFGEKIADGILEIKSSKSIAFFSAQYI